MKLMSSPPPSLRGLTTAFDDIAGKDSTKA